MAKSNKTRQRIATLLAERPGLTAPEIAAALGISRQSVYTNRDGLAVARAVPVYSLPGTRKVPAPPAPRITVGDHGSAVIDHTAAGTVAELIVAADLIARGWLVFLPVVRTEGCDIIAFGRDYQTLLRVEVRSGHRNAGGVVRFMKKTGSQHDHYGIVVTGEAVTYEPPLPPSPPKVQRSAGGYRGPV